MLGFGEQDRRERDMKGERDRKRWGGGGGRQGGRKGEREGRREEERGRGTSK